MNTYAYLRQKLLWSFIICLMLPLVSSAQDYSSLVNDYLSRHVENSDLVPSDVQSWTITNQFDSRHNGVTHLHIRQTYQNLEIYNATANFSIKDGTVRYMTDRLKANIAQRANATTPTLTAEQAIQAVASSLEINGAMPQQIGQKGYFSYIYEKGGISQEEIPVKLMYFNDLEDNLKLVWDLSIYQLDSKHWWSVRVDALTGQILDQTDWVVSCNIPDHPKGAHSHQIAHNLARHAAHRSANVAQYNVFDFKTESPNHGPPSLVIDPADLTFSPFGWHDTDGVDGPEFTITRGNNVYAYEDRDADNNPGYSPDGGGALDFDFPLNLNQQPIGYEDAAITNLFYLNNVMHDIMGI